MAIQRRQKQKQTLQKQMSKSYIMSLVSKVCCSSLAHIRNEARLRRVKEGSLNVDNYADFAACILLANVQKHFKTEGLLE